MAAPHATGALALYLSLNPGVSPAELKERAIGTTTGIAGCSPKFCGSGIVNAYQVLANDPKPTPTPTLVPTYEPATPYPSPDATPTSEVRQTPTFPAPTVTTITPAGCAITVQDFAPIASRDIYQAWWGASFFNWLADNEEHWTVLPIQAGDQLVISVESDNAEVCDAFRLLFSTSGYEVAP